MEHDQTSESSPSSGNGESDPSFEEVHTPPGTTPLDVNTTPSQRKLVPASSLSPRVKRWVDAADPNKGRCVVTKIPSTNNVDYCHVIPRSIKPDELDKLEYAWGKPWKTFNVDTRYNILKIEVNLHRSFDAGLWLLLPELKVAKRLADISKIKSEVHARKLSKLSEEQTRWVYTMVPSTRMRDFHMCRRIRTLDGSEKLKEEDLKVEVYPFMSLPKITSHVLPHYAAYNAGAKMSGGSDLAEEHTLGKDISRTIPYVEKFYRRSNKDIPPKHEGNFRQKTQSKKTYASDRTAPTRVQVRVTEPSNPPSSYSSRKRRRRRDEDNDLNVDA